MEDSRDDASLCTRAASDFNYIVQSGCVGRVLITTSKGYVGRGPEQVVNGDLVVLMPGGKVPYVLRPIHGATSAPEEESTPIVTAEQQEFLSSRASSPHSSMRQFPNETEDVLELPAIAVAVQHYTFLGDAYVHGIMDGEAWDEEQLKRIILV
jgi:hypothetical protein